MAIVIGRYYLTLPLVIGFYNLFDWEIAVIDVGQDATQVAKDQFHSALPAAIKSYTFLRENSLIKHLTRADYDIVFTTTVKHKGINKAKMLGLLRHFYIIFGAFLKPSLASPSTAGVIAPAEKKSRIARLIRKMVSWRSYRSLLNTLLGKVRKTHSDHLNNPAAYDLVFCWNEAEAHYYEGNKQVITAHPYHVYLAGLAKTSAFKKRILVAHSGNSDYYTSGYNELIEAIIEKYEGICEVFIKAHPLSKELPKFRGTHRVVYDVLDEKEAGKYDIFINEDSYMGVEMFFRGKYVINYGVLDQSASNVAFTHMWSYDTNEILTAIDSVIDNWDEINSKHIAELTNYYHSYIPPPEFGPLRAKRSSVI